MVTYIVSISDHYYPRGGKGDWIYVGTDYDQALEALKKTNVTRVEEQSGYLIAVEDGTARVLEERWSDE